MDCPKQSVLLRSTTHSVGTIHVVFTTFIPLPCFFFPSFLPLFNFCATAECLKEFSQLRNAVTMMTIATEQHQVPAPYCA